MEMNRIRKGKGRRKGQAGQEKGQALRPVPGMASAYGVPVLLGGDGSVFSEDLGKAALGRIVQADRDLREGVVRVAEKIGSLPALFPVNVFRDSHVHLFLKADGEGAAAETAVAGEQVQGDGLMQMDRDAGEAFLNDLGEGGPFRRQRLPRQRGGGHAGNGQRPFPEGNHDHGKEKGEGRDRK